MGNLRDTSSADGLKTISQTDPSIDLRWIAHWGYQRCANAQTPYTPPTERPQPPVSVTDLPR
jgi:hypothetical protein